MKARGAAYAASAKSLPGINSAFLMPMLRYSPDSITPIFFRDLQQRTQSAEEGNLTERDEGAKTDRRTDNFSQQGHKGHKYKSSEPFVSFAIFC